VNGFCCNDNTHVCKLIALYTANAYSAYGAEHENVLAVWLVTLFLGVCASPVLFVV